IAQDGSPRVVVRVCARQVDRIADVRSVSVVVSGIDGIVWRSALELNEVLKNRNARGIGGPVAVKDQVHIGGPEHQRTAMIGDPVTGRPAQGDSATDALVSAARIVTRRENMFCQRLGTLPAQGGEKYQQGKRDAAQAQ